MISLKAEPLQPGVGIMTALARKVEPQNRTKEMMEEFDANARARGFRPPVRADLVAGTNLFLMAVARAARDYSFKKRYQIEIILTDPPIRRSSPESEETVHYTLEGRECEATLEEFCAAGYVHKDEAVASLAANDTRYIIKAT